VLISIFERHGAAVWAQRLIRRGAAVSEAATGDAAPADAAPADAATDEATTDEAVTKEEHSVH